ncbi:DUF6314 family protein [Actibacterium sp. MT2.3-13A]|uniref:DUF6314 family protein n=1 Tax=Actibacterium sp. MT2.3-13A TaxID=2828332 RepID=UPI001BAC022A|nr:DUF6314 family protein [Actibacterium sp. MT2.3-13A]
MQQTEGTRPALADFEGRWRLEREIDDAKAGQRARFSGTATFTREAAGGLLCDEAGTLILPGQPPLAAARRYLWRAEGGDIAVFFHDGRPFHLIAPGARPEAGHDCPPDLYQVRYDFRRWPEWRAEWRVSGRRKDYLMRSTYARLV